MSNSVYSQGLLGLKDFQMKTVDFVFKRLYGNSPTRRYLVADEVGLGKTMVARGVIAKAIDHLMDDKSIKRIDIVYICSNISIATQNIEKLNVAGDEDGFTLATRMTYLPVQVKALKSKRVTFVSLTPRTTFDHSASRGGTMDERAIIYHMLYDLPWARGKLRQSYRRGFLNLLQGLAGKPSWESTRNYYHLDSHHFRIKGSRSRKLKAECKACIDNTLATEFRKNLLANSSLYYQLKDVAYRFKRIRKNIPDEDKELRYRVIGELRKMLAHSCVSALEPDLVIMDEFQRFKDLLGGGSESANLAEAVFNYGNARVLLLSATPYKMLTTNAEATDQNHYQEFINTLKFLYNDDGELNKVTDLIAQWRTAILTNKLDSPEMGEVRERLEKQLLQVMCRTERIKFTREFNAMMTEDRFSSGIELTSHDLLHARFIDKIALELDAGDIREYWKSAPYLLNFLKHYAIRNKFDKVIDSNHQVDRGLSGVMADHLKINNQHLLHEGDIKNYKAIEMGNARLRTIVDDTIGKGMWKYLWIPPSMPYTQPSGVYKDSQEVTKSVIFSSWNAVPDAISTICSYEAERKMVEGTPREGGYHKEVSTPLVYGKKQSSQLVLTWVLPFPTLARLVDPLQITLEHGGGSPIKMKQLLAIAKTLIKKQLSSIQHLQSRSQRDNRWYWMAPFLMEGEEYHAWLTEMSTNPSYRHKGDNFWSSLISQIESSQSLLHDPSELGTFPKDLEEVLVAIALGAPGTCASRAISRVSTEKSTHYHPDLLYASFRIGNSFRTIFNSPEVVSMIGKLVSGRTYLRKTLKYAMDGNLQSLLDEYVHMLSDTPNMRLKTEDKRFKAIAEMLQSVLSIRSAQISVDDFEVQGGNVKISDFPIRTRFALRYSDFKEDKESTITRATTVKDAFNSPFRPFMLASTSVGQEGLDFHVWCHAIIHWNLPSNPVDLEQREGRIHRYKGHAIRKNVAEIYGLKVLNQWDGRGDPWELVFGAAREDNKDKPELIPYWIFDQGKAKIQRRLPILPFSKEESRIEGLKKGLSLYRLVFGQPRQEDLINKFDAMETQSIDFSKHLISLDPPPR